MSAKREIKPVEDNLDKFLTYKAQKGRLAAALRGGFYFEAILIDYALLEDRLRSFLYYLGLIKDRGSVKTYKIAKDSIASIIDKYKRDDEKSTFGVVNIGDKIKVVRALANWATNSISKDENAYLIAIRKSYENTDISYLLELLDKIEIWKNYRNEIIHSLMNKNIDSLNEKIEEKAIEGRKLAEQIDNQLRCFKKGNLIRKSLKLSDD